MQVVVDVFVDFFSMSEPVPRKRPRTGDSSLANVASPTAEEKLYDVEMSHGVFWSHFYKFGSMYQTTRCAVCVYNVVEVNVPFESPNADLSQPHESE